MKNVTKSVALSAFLALASCDAQPRAETAPDATAAPAPAPEAVPGAPAAAAADPAPATGVVYLDVRTPEEYAAGHVAGSVFVPHDQIAARAAELAQYRDRDIVVYCRTGRRSALAIDALRSLGFTRLENGGGLEDVVRSRNVTVEGGR